MKSSSKVKTLFFLIGALLISGSCSLSTITAQRYALVIGVAAYPSLPSKDQLTYPVIDADSMTTLLTSKGYTVQELTNTLATKSGIKSAMKSFFASIPTNSTALIYYSGHGTNNLRDPREVYIVPENYDGYDSTSLIGNAELASWIKSYIPTQNVIVIADSCYSGGFVDTSESVDSIPADYSSLNGGKTALFPFSALSSLGTLLSKNAAASGSLEPITISAAGTSESSYEEGYSYNHGIFTYFLLKSALYGDANGDGHVTCTEAYGYVKNNLNSIWNSSRPPTDQFMTHISGTMRDLVLF
jgi:hypothetical protein